MLCVFFRRCVSGNPPNCFGVFYSSTLLRFFVQRVFCDELLRRSGVGVDSVFLYGKSYIFVRKNPRQKVLFLLAWRFCSSPFLRDADSQGFVGRTSAEYWDVF